MEYDPGLINLIDQSLSNEPIPVRELSQNTSATLKDLAQAGAEYRLNDGPWPGKVITHRSRPEFLLLPIAHAPEYLQALAENAARQAAESMDHAASVASDAEVARAIEQA